MTKQYDAIIIGAGHNGLACATYLAKAGKKVVVLEARSTVGGMASTKEFAPGFKVGNGAQYATMLNKDVIKDLGIQIEYAAKDIATIAVNTDGNNIRVAGDTVEGVSSEDKAQFADFKQHTRKFAKLMTGALKVRPPKVVEGDWHDKINLMKLGLKMRLLGTDDMRDLMRIATINLYDVLTERFDNGQLKGLMTLDGIYGNHLAPRSPNTVLNYLYRRTCDLNGFNDPALVKGGMGAVGQAFADAAIKAGVEIRTDAKVASINVYAEAASGVTLENGETIDATAIVSGADPKTTFQKLVGARNIEAGFTRRIKNFKAKGNVAKLHVALNDLPKFAGVADADAGGRIVITGDMDYVERAFNHAKYGEYSDKPVLDINIPSVHDDSLAPAGKHVMTVLVQYAPYDLRAGWENEKANFEAKVIDMIEDHAPGFKGMIEHSELLTPVDLEAEFGAHGGHWHHGELTLNQFLMTRPVPTATQYATPVDNLYLASAGTHPGGGVSGLCGHNAAKQILRTKGV